MSMRASDHDRERTVAALEQHAGAGRLSLDEFADRARIAHDARTLDDLAAVLHDLPTDLPADAAGSRSGRELFLVLVVAILALLAVALFMAFSRG